MATSTDRKEERNRLVGIGLALGAGIGLLLGMIVFDNAGIGLAMGPAIGLALALAVYEFRRNSDKAGGDSRPPEADVAER